MEEKRLISTLSDWDTLAVELIDRYSDIKIYLLHGNLGAGKTSFVKSMVHALGSQDITQSPTFSIINEYDCGKEKIYHMDLYRLKNIEEILDLGFEEYLDSGSYCFIEWPEFAIPLIRGPVAEVFIEYTGETGRYVQFSFKKL